MRKRKGAGAGAGGRVHLPREIMMDILLRLPFDSILRCKQVSKEWKHMINDPMFYKLYRDNDSMALFLHTQHVYCLRIRHDKKKLTHAQNPRFTVHQIPIQLEYTRFSNALSYYHHQVLSRGSSNGLACVKGINGCFYFYNLFTGGSGSSYTVTDAPMHQLDDSWICYGFGYDARNDDYNILVVCDYQAHHDHGGHGIGSGFQFDTNTVQNKDNTLFWVYSFKNQGWKPLDGFPYSTYYSWTGPPQATTIDGVLHWFVPNHPEEEVIVTYDLHSGRFGEIPAPINAYAAALPHQTHYLGDLAELNGRLCYVHKMAFPNPNKPKPKHIYRLDVWVMNEYGVPHSWAKLVTMDCSKLHPLRLIPWKRNWQTPLVLHQCGDGRVLVLFVCHHVSGQLFWYDPLDHKFEVLVKSTWKRQRIQQRKRKLTPSFASD